MLESLGIPVMVGDFFPLFLPFWHAVQVDLPAVGTNLQDQALVTSLYLGLPPQHADWQLLGSTCPWGASSELHYADSNTRQIRCRFVRPRTEFNYIQESSCHRCFRCGSEPNWIGENSNSTGNAVWGARWYSSVSWSKVLLNDESAAPIVEITYGVTEQILLMVTWILLPQ